MSVEKKKYDCSALPKGWQREEVIRKSGLSAGKVDVYYYSPNGKKFRSKPQLARYLGDALDLATFDFRSGKINSLLLRKNKKQRGTQFDYSRGVRNDASLVPPIRQTASIFKQPVTVYKTQEGKVKTDFKHGPQEKPKQVKIGKLQGTAHVGRMMKTRKVVRQEEKGNFVDNKGNVKNKKSGNIIKNNKSRNIGTQKKLRIVEKDKKSESIDNKKSVNIDQNNKRRNETRNVGKNKKSENDDKIKTNVNNKKKILIVDMGKRVSHRGFENNLQCMKVVDKSVVNIIETDIPLLDRFGVPATWSEVEGTPVSSAPMNEASEVQMSEYPPKTNYREDCSSCSEREQLKRNLLIEHLQLINYKTKLEVMDLERKLGVAQSDFKNAN